MNWIITWSDNSLEYGSCGIYLQWTGKTWTASHENAKTYSSLLDAAFDISMSNIPSPQPNGFRRIEPEDTVRHMERLRRSGNHYINARCHYL